MFQIKKHITSHQQIHYVFFDGGIDMVLSRIIFPNIEPKVKKIVKDLNIRSIVGIPIGSSIIIDHETDTNM